jgi:uncharacterized protein YjbI with pentapeptide repeats
VNKAPLDGIVGGANSVERGYQGMADDGSQQRKPDFRTAVEDVKALAKVLATEPQFVLGRRLNFRSPAVLAAIGVVATLVLALMVVLALLRTGGAKAVSDNAALIGALAALGGILTAQMVSIALDDRRTQETRELEDRRTQEARELEAQRAHEAALQNYFEQVGTLLIEQPLREASPGDNLSTVVRAQTLSVLEGLDPERKQLLLLFLYESGLIYKDKPVVSLVGANLRDAHLERAKLQEANLQDAHFRGATLRDAHLERANLQHAYLQEANLQETNLRGANLEGAHLRGANLEDAKLQEANLRGVRLHDAKITDKQLADAQSLQGATMPNGQKYEDWLRDK